MEIESKLMDRNQYTFFCFRAKGDFVKKFSEKTGQVTNKLIGIRILNSLPLFATNAEWRHIKDLNGQIMNRDNPDTNSRYYILKK
jgi:hypothetical protein